MLVGVVCNNKWVRDESPHFPLPHHEPTALSNSATHYSPRPQPHQTDLSSHLMAGKLRAVTAQGYKDGAPKELS